MARDVKVLEALHHLRKCFLRERVFILFVFISRMIPTLQLRLRNADKIVVELPILNSPKGICTIQEMPL